ncbi:MAG: ElyC/SanA/YdcF family protein [Solirubrobacteraceae bacterium]|nr:ElyC/SanA/YdcF family protein [Patulibacter sp.]
MRRRLVMLVLLVLLVVFGGRLALLLAASDTPSVGASGDKITLPRGQHRAAIVFGAGLNQDGQPSALLRDRIRAAVQLEREGSVDLLLMTGDNSRHGYSEPSAMRTSALALGATRVAVDYGGDRTWDSCKRASTVFGVQRAIVVSNDFHRARTVEDCKAAGIEVDGAVGTSTAKYPIGDRANWEARELVASWRGVVDAWIHHPAVKVAGKPIDPYDACAVNASFNPQDKADSTTPTGC